MPNRFLTTALAVLLLVAACGTAKPGGEPAEEARAGTRPAASAATAASAVSTVTTPCGWRTTPPATYHHVIWIFLENHSYGELIGQPDSPQDQRSPYLNSLARRCGLATNFWGITHPSLPNYLAAVSGSTGGVKTSCTPATCPQHRVTLFQQLRNHHKGWRVYAESMPANCRRTDAYPYVVRHNPPTYFPAVRNCYRWDVPMGTTTSGRLVYDLAHDLIPSMSIIIPNQCNNTHDCPIETGDRWLSRLVPKILASPDYRQGRTALFVTYDEGAGGYAGQSCRQVPDSSCHIVTVAVSPTTRPGTRSSTRFNHYSLLETTERMFGITTLLRYAGHAATYSMRKPFNL